MCHNDRIGAFMTKLSKSRIEWAINETQSMKQAAKLLNVAYHTFKKYAKLYEVFHPAESLIGIKRTTSGGYKQPELEDIFAGHNPNYSDTKLLHRCYREGYLAEECNNCGFDEYRPKDMMKPLMLDYLDDDSTNKALSNLRLLCYNCFYILKMDRLGVNTPENVKSFQKAIIQVFSTE